MRAHALRAAIPASWLQLIGLAQVGSGGYTLEGSERMYNGKDVIVVEEAAEGSSE